MMMMTIMMTTRDDDDAGMVLLIMIMMLKFTMPDTDGLRRKEKIQSKTDATKQRAAFFHLPSLLGISE